MDRIYMCIDLKSFYASVECVERNLDSMKTNLVVADESRGGGTICLAVSPSLKALGVKNRCRLFEIDKGIDFIIAKPRMKLYMEYSANIYRIYLKYVSKDDIYVYSIDECFLDVTKYLKLYQKTPVELAKIIIEDVYNTYGIRATCGIGTNLFLCKVALDITAKHSPDFIGYLDEDIYKQTIWYHEPITDIWNVGNGIAKRLAKYGIYNMYGVTQIKPEKLYQEFGVNAEYLIDHANGVEPCTIEDIHKYSPSSHSLSQGQVLFSDYTYEEALIILKEMVDLNCLDLVDKHLVTNNIGLMIRYSKEHHKITNASAKLDKYTNSRSELMELFVNLYLQKVDKTKLIRGIIIGFNNVKSDIYQDYTLLDDVEKLNKERKINETIVELKKKYGKNSVIKAMDLQPKATTIMRNKQIGGHNEE